MVMVCRYHEKHSCMKRLYVHPPRKPQVAYSCFQEFIFWVQKTVPDRIPEEFFFFLRFPEEFFTGTWFWRGRRSSGFFPILQEFFTGIPVGRNSCIYSGFLRNSGGFLFPPKAVWLRPATKKGSLLSKIWTKIDIFNLSPEQDLSMVSAAPVLCWRLLA